MKKHFIYTAAYRDDGSIATGDADTGIYLTQGDGVAVSVTAEMLADALSEIIDSRDRLRHPKPGHAILTKLLEADHG